MRTDWIYVLLVAVMVALGSPNVVHATTSVEVAINATPSLISVSSNVSDYDFGTVDPGVNQTTDSGYFGIVNYSQVSTNNTISSTGWSSGWSWSSAGQDSGRLYASDGDGAFDVEVPDAGSANLKLNVPSTTDWVFELKLETPTSFTSGAQQSTVITISASQA